MFHPELPKDAQTSLKMQGQITMKTEGGEYYNFGLAKGLISLLKSLILPVNLNILKLQFNIGGLPLLQLQELARTEVYCF